MMERVVVTGLGTLNATAKSAPGFAQALREGRCGIGPFSVFDPSTFRTQIAAEVKDFNPHDHIPRQYPLKRMSRADLLGFAATLFAVLLIGYGWGPLAALGAVVAAGTIAGMVNGVLISRFRMQPFVATLAMMVAARGGAKMLSGGIKVQPGAREWYAMQGPPPAFFEWMTRPTPVFGLQPATLLFLLSIAIMVVVVRFTAFGRRLYAVGGNEEAARLSGIRVGGVKIIAYGLCAVFAAIAGAVNASRVQIGDPEAGATYELDAIAAVVIGGTSLAGGRGGMFLTLIGTLIIAYINKILSINNVDEAYRLLAKGVIIVAAVLIQQKGK